MAVDTAEQFRSCCSSAETRLLGRLPESVVYFHSRSSQPQRKDRLSPRADHPLEEQGNKYNLVARELH